MSFPLLQDLCENCKQQQIYLNILNLYHSKNIDLWKKLELCHKEKRIGSNKKNTKNVSTSLILN